MEYWFENPQVKTLIPLSISSALKGLFTAFSVPRIFVGTNVMPTGPVLGPTTMHALAPRCPRRRALVVTDGFNRRYFPRVRDFLSTGQFSCRLWDQTQPEAPLENVAACARALADFQPDLVLALGGGSVMDLAKGAWLLYERPDIEALALVSPRTPLGLRRKAMLAAVPTTSGTGSECTGTAVFTDTAAQRKIPVTHAELVPDVAILDPSLTLSVPPPLTAGTGLDVLAHALDAVTTPGANHYTLPLALRALELVFTWLPRAFAHGDDREARQGMMIAANLAGIAFGMSGCHLSHSLGHALGAVFELHHGLAVGIALPYTTQFCARASDAHLAACRALDIPAPTPEQGLAGLVAKVRGLLAALEVPSSLEGLGIEQQRFEDNLPRLVELAHGDISCLLSPRPVTAAQCERLLRHAYQGRDVDF